MKIVYLISENSLKQAKNYPKEQILLFKETYKFSINSEYKTITSAEIAKNILQVIKKKIGTNSVEKAEEITKNISNDEKNEFFLIYSDPITNKNLEKKTLLIVENNKELNQIDAQKIYLIPPWPIVIEKIIKTYPKHEIQTINEADEKFFRVKEYFRNLKL